MTKLLRRRPKSVKGMDQLLLGMYIWPLAQGDVVCSQAKITCNVPMLSYYLLLLQIAHDSYLCGKYPPTYPFPTQRNGSMFVGMIVIGEQQVGTAEICPENCRPSNHMDWIYC